MKLHRIALLLALAAGSASATVVQTTGAGTAVDHVTNFAGFEADTALAASYVEDGLLFTYVGSADNDGCGYAGAACGLVPELDYGAGFSGNYLATAGAPAYIDIRMADGGAFYGIEFTAGTGYLNLFGYWQTYADGVLTGAGKFTSATSTAVLGLSDTAGFDEVRYYALSSAAGGAAGYSAPAIDNVSVDVPEPATLALFAGALLAMGGVRRRRRTG